MRRCWDMAPARSTHIWPTPPSPSWWKKAYLKKDYYAAVEDYGHAVLQGIVKIASKMGISTIQSYQGSQIFRRIGPRRSWSTDISPGTSRIGGLTLKDIADHTDAQHSRAFDPLGLQVDLTLSSMGRAQDAQPGRGPPLQSQTIHLLQRPPARTIMRILPGIHPAGGQ